MVKLRLNCLGSILAGFRASVAAKPAVMPREGGASSTRRPIRSIMAVSEYWIVRSSRTMTAVVRMVLENIRLTKDVRLMSTATHRNTR
ncbi:hypothetical protein BST63_33585 [Bradyrhizobium canariense]|uniref:Secreted protein n=1 Tax=Bradyrhizobium canariense TaxID=255045 RepID=A0ABX3WTL8_9BRAD|nr:hypothetical protein BSZ23_29610 [Bradyrhizobium canariense]OSJ21877.1 hypothetical protein BST63_33585 [Bradyrhizobium canariense]